MIRGIHHFALHTRNFEAMASFYQDVLGFETIEQQSWSDSEVIDGVIGVHNSAAKQMLLRAGNCHIELFEYLNPEGRPAQPLRPFDPGYTHFCLDVVDIDAEYDRLTAAGMKFVNRPTHFDSFAAVYGQDPDGNIIEIQETSPLLHSDLSKLPLVRA